MIYGYIRVSSDKQNTENQRFEILKYADVRKFKVNIWLEETISSTKKLEQRKLAKLLKDLKKNDVLIISELSRLGRSLMEIMTILNSLMEKNVKVFAIKEGYELGNNINSKVLAFAFGLSAEIERQLISQRTKEALARKKSEGKQLGRPKGSLSKMTKLTGKEKVIQEFLKKRIPVTAIARILEVNRLTLNNFIKSRNLNERNGMER